MAKAESNTSSSTAPPPDHRYHSEFDTSANPDRFVAEYQHALRLPPLDQNTSSVTIYPAPHLANCLTPRLQERRTAESILEQLQFNDDTRAGLIQSSFQAGAEASFTPASNGFVEAAIEAYSQHYHLKIRPEDVWLAILTQLSSYINAHAQELRGSFVAHDGKKKLKIIYEGGTRFTVDWADFAYKIGTMIQDHVVDPELRQWMMPAFTTSNSHDVVVASIVMMASMQAYFSYAAEICCGFPSVTLLGTKADYELILHRLDKLRNYGEEPTLFADLLTPILKRFVLSFDEPHSEEIKSFWNRIFSQYDMGSGPTFMTGWITGFSFWDADGKMLYRPHISRSMDENLPPLTLDGMTYHTIDRYEIPQGFCKVPVDIKDNGQEIKAEMMAGSIGWQCSSSGGEVCDPKEGTVDTFQPKSGWWIYEKIPEDVVQARRAEKERLQNEEYAKWKAEIDKQMEELAAKAKAEDGEL